MFRALSVFSRSPASTPPGEENHFPFRFRLRHEKDRPLDNAFARRVFHPFSDRPPWIKR